MYLKRLLLILLFIGGIVKVSSAQAPPVQWIKCYGDSRNNIGIDIHQTRDDGYIITGRYHFPEREFPDPYVLKINDQGDSLWASSFSGDGVNEAIFSRSTDDEGYIVIGNLRVHGVSESSILAAKLDSNGTIVWEYSYGDEGIDIASNCLASPDGGLLVTGFSQIGNGINYDIFLMRINSNGDTLWTRTFGYNHFDIGSSIARAQPEGYIVLCDIDFPYGGSRLNIMLINENGDSLWTRSYGEFAGTGVSIIELSDGGYVILSNTLYYDGTYHGEYAVHLMKIRDDGEILWARCLKDDYELTGSSIAETADSGFIISASAGPYWDTDQCIIRTNSQGDTLWTKRIQGAEYGMDFARGILIANDGSYVFTGKLSASDNRGHLSIVNLTADQVEIEQPYDRLIPRNTVLSQNYPNPFNATTTITFDIPESQLVTLKLYDLLGCEITILYNENSPPGVHDIHFNASELSSGFYIYRLQAGNYSESKKMILLK